MAPTYEMLSVLLVQVRERSDIELEEQQSFLHACGLQPHQLSSVNVLHDRLHEGLLDSVDAVLIGGAGAFSVTEDHPWTSGLLSLIESICHRRLPLFGSCWGHQIIARALGGTVVHDPIRAELGCFPVSLTQAARQDPLFGTLPSAFAANLGHHDRVAALPEQAVELALSETAPYQAFRLKDLPVYGTQFHGELTAGRLRQRLLTYRSYYPELQDDAAFDAMLASLSETPEANRLLKTFLRTFAVSAMDDTLPSAA